MIFYDGQKVDKWKVLDLQELDNEYGILTLAPMDDERGISRASREDWDLSKWADFLRTKTAVIELDGCLAVEQF